NGLFAFTGLGDGDYELIVEKDGVIIDRRIVPVEQGKISPLFIDVKRKKKRLEFFDPHNEEVVPTVAVQFFDGEESLELDEKGQVLSRVVGGSDPNLIDYANADGYVASTFISRQRGFERVAVLNKKLLDKLISDNGFEEANGLAVGYIKSEVKYEVYLEESSYNNVIYFNSAGQEIDPTTEPAFGFIIHGFNQGLHTLSVQTVDDNILAMTDLIFSDHQSISVVHSAIESL
ncbi:MAG: hypothetical protein MJK18_14340, partial [Bdellovibrionales bacterium]|nr:hypothetical protein [Bdellovibrionales bacterium]